MVKQTDTTLKESLGIVLYYLLSKASISKNPMKRIILSYKNFNRKSKISAFHKQTYGVSGNGYRVATLSKSNSTVTEIGIQRLKPKG